MRTKDFALPHEVLWNICEKLPRRDIEAALFVRRSFRDAINCRSDGPRRHIESLIISEPTDLFPFLMYAKKSTIDKHVDEHAECNTVEEAVAIMKSCNVNKLDIGDKVTVDDALIDALLPIKASWANALLDLDCRYSSGAVLERAFNELFLCRGMELKFPDTGRFELSVPFFSLAAARDCNKLEIYGQAQYPVEATELCDWLHREKKWDEENCASKKNTKVLSLYETAVSDVNEFLNMLKAELKAASKPNPYKLTLYSQRYDIGLNESHHHKKTLEIMSIESGDDDFQEPPCYILVKREIKKNQRYFDDDSDEDDGSEQAHEDANDDSSNGVDSDHEQDEDDDEDVPEADSGSEPSESEDEDNVAVHMAKRRRLAD